MAGRADRQIPDQRRRSAYRVHNRAAAYGLPLAAEVDLEYQVGAGAAGRASA